jgi:hypothetical protein
MKSCLKIEDEDQIVVRVVPTCAKTWDFFTLEEEGRQCRGARCFSNSEGYGGFD